MKFYPMYMYALNDIQILEGCENKGERILYPSGTFLKYQCYVCNMMIS